MSSRVENHIRSWVGSFYFQPLLGSQPLQSTLTNEASRTVSIKKLKGSGSPLLFPDLLPLTSLPPSAARGSLRPPWLQPPAFQKPCPHFRLPDAWNHNLWNRCLRGAMFPQWVCDLHYFNDHTFYFERIKWLSWIFDSEKAIYQEEISWNISESAVVNELKIQSLIAMNARTLH